MSARDRPHTQGALIAREQQPHGRAAHGSSSSPLVAVSPVVAEPCWCEAVLCVTSSQSFCSLVGMSPVYPLYITRYLTLSCHVVCAHRYAHLWQRSGDHEVLCLRTTIPMTLLRWRGVITAGTDTDKVAKLHLQNPSMPTIYHIFRCVLRCHVRVCVCVCVCVCVRVLIFIAFYLPAVSTWILFALALSSAPCVCVCGWVCVCVCVCVYTVWVVLFTLVQYGDGWIR